MKDESGPLYPLLCAMCVAAAGIAAWAQAQKRADAGNAETIRKVRWLKEQGVPIRSIDPKDADFSDLMPLVTRIGAARIVLLGEQSHGDGATFLAKCRLIRFLHEKMGFDVLAWESGLFDCRQMEEALRAGGPVKDAIAQGLFPIWGDSRQVRPIFDYARTTYGSPHPLEMAGFDCQFSSYFAESRYGPALETFFDDADPQLLSDAQRETIRTAVKRLYKLGKASAEERSAYQADMEGILGLFSSAHDRLLKKHDAREIAFYRRTVENVRVFAKLQERSEDAGKGSFHASDIGVRDRSMGDNLLWLARERYPTQKIIVWAASFHVMHNGATIDTLSPSLDYKGLVTMGQPVHEALGDRIYTIAFTAYQGRAGNAFSKPWTLPAAATDSLERLLHDTGRAYLFVDLRGPRKQAGQWICAPQLARPLGYNPMRADWSRVFDAFIFTDTMFPSTRDDTVAGR